MKKNTFYVLISVVIAITGCNYTDNESNDYSDILKKDTLTSWQSTCDGTSFCIDTLINFVERVTTDSSSLIPPEDRIAVFDMDGTIACERPISMELFFASYWGLDSIVNCQVDAKKLQDAVKNHFGSYLSCNITSDSLISLAKIYSDSINNLCIPINKPNNIPLSKLFYKPMIEVIEFLINNGFQVYIVSGSSQQFIRGIVKNVPVLKDLPPSHFIGSLQKYDTIKHIAGAGPEFYLSKENFLSNVSSGKAINIYNRIGKIPVIAFGNTVNDFDMFSYTSTCKYETLCVLINHDSDDWESSYKAYDSTKIVIKNWNNPALNNTNWSKTIFDSIMSNHGWHVANMSRCFVQDSVFIK
jgi:hypothetical protein